MGGFWIANFGNYPGDVNRRGSHPLHPHGSTWREQIMPEVRDAAGIPHDLPLRTSPHLGKFTAIIANPLAV